MKSLLCTIVCLQLFGQLLAAPGASKGTLAPCAEQDLVITVDNKLEVYIDGVLATGLANADNWQIADTVKVPASAKVIAVRGEDTGVVAGILASGANFHSGGSWKCSNTPPSADWKAASFDDSRWSPATVIGKHGVSPWGNVAGISGDASWIWTSKHQYGPDSDKVVYCRKRLPACDSCAGVGTGPSCIASCDSLDNGDYQSCETCNRFITCSNHILYDMPCAPNDPPLVWDDTAGVKRCEYTSPTCSVCNHGVKPPCSVTGTGSSCIKTCDTLDNGDYQSCKTCNGFITCSNHILYEMPCAPSDPPLVWDDQKKTCEHTSPTCTECID